MQCDAPQPTKPRCEKRERRTIQRYDDDDVFLCGPASYVYAVSFATTEGPTPEAKETSRCCAACPNRHPKDVGDTSKLQ